MSDPVNSPNTPGDLSAVGGAQHSEGLQAPTGGASTGGVNDVLFELQKEAGTDARADRKMAALSKESALQAKAARLAADNKSIQDGLDDATKKLDELMRAAVVLLALGIIAGGIAALAGAFAKPHTEIDGIAGVVAITPPRVEIEGAGGTKASPLAASCALNLASPRAAAGIPVNGPVVFQWTDIPEATAYDLEVSPLAEKGPPWQFSTTGTSKTIYMEDFPAGGDYKVSLKAIRSNGDVLCAAAFQFTKEASDLPVRKPDEGGKSVCYQKPCP